MNKCNDCNSKVRTSCRGCIHFYSGYSDLFEPKKSEPRVLWLRVDDAGELIGPTFERKDKAEDGGAKVVEFIEVSSLKYRQHIYRTGFEAGVEVGKKEIMDKVEKLEKIHY